MVAVKKGFSLPKLTKDKKKELTEWALEYSDGIKDFRFYLAVGTYCAAISITEQYGTDTEASRQMSQAIARKYPELAEIAKTRSTELISKSVIGKLVNRGTSGEASTRVVEAFSELMGLEQFKIWEYLCNLGVKVLGEGKVDHVPLGSGATAMLALQKHRESQQRELEETEKAIATLMDREHRCGNNTSMENQTICTTFNLPSDLLAETDQAVQSGKAKSRDEFVALALRHELAALKRAEIDAAMVDMTNDPDYQTQVLQMEAEFANAQWEAFQAEEVSE